MSESGQGPGMYFGVNGFGEATLKLSMCVAPNGL